jgi:Trp operon repressor
MTTVTKSKPKGVTLTENGRYPIVPLHSIEVVERPESGKEAEQIFYNPRSLESFTSEKMKSLRDSIQEDGLHSPLTVRAFTEDGTRKGAITRIQLVAGERRFRSINWLYDNDALCYDDMTETQVSAKKLYVGVPCKVLYNIDDKEALRVAFQENNEHLGLCVREEVELVERLLNGGMKQEEIVVMLGTNVTWVSQTMNFRKQLPAGAFAKLLEGNLARHVAVQILSFKPEDRANLYEKACETERKQTSEARTRLTTEVEVAEDELSLETATVEIAKEEGDEATAAKHARKGESARKRLELAQTRLDRTVAEAGTIRQGHLQEAAQTNRITPKKNKMLNRQSIEQFYFDLVNNWSARRKLDNFVKKLMPSDVLDVISCTAQAILAGESDPGMVVRTVMARRGEWKVDPQHQLPNEMDMCDDDDDDDSEE